MGVIPLITIVDYQAGNLTSVAAAFESLGYSCLITSDPAHIECAERIVFPGVGAAGAAMRSLSELGLTAALKTAIAQGRPFMGICLGYQVLFRHSEEDDTDCLQILDGAVLRFPESVDANGRVLKIPHMGWNRVTFHGKHHMWAGISPGSEFYFVHSYYPVPRPDLVAATTEYGIGFAAGVLHRNLVAFQFHPEKSGRPGLRLLANFCTWRPSE